MTPEGGSRYWNPLKVLDYTGRTGLVLNEASGLNGAIIPSCGAYNGTDDTLTISGGAAQEYAGNIEIEFKAKCTATIASNVAYGFCTYSSTDYISLRSATTMRVTVGGTILTFARPTNDKLWHIYKVRFIQGATTIVRVWIDGTESATGTLDVASVKPFKYASIGGPGTFLFPGNIAYFKVTDTDTSTILNRFEITGHGLFEYDIAGSQYGTWVGTGVHYAFDAAASTYLLDSGFSMWQKVGAINEYIPYDGDTTYIATQGYSNILTYAGSSTGYNKAPSLVGFNPTASDSALLTHFDRSNETIQTAVSRASSYYSATSLITKCQYHCSELEYAVLDTFFETAYKNLFWCKNNAIPSTLIESFFIVSETPTASHLVYLMNYTKSTTWIESKYNFEQGLLIMTFDDNTSTQIDTAFPILTAKGAKATFYCASDWVTGIGGRMSWANLITLHNAGMDIQCHSTDNTDLSTLTEAEIITRLQTVNAAFVANGLPTPRHISYPGGGYNATVRDALINSGLRVTGRDTGSPPTLDQQYRRSDKYTFEAQTLDEIDDAAIVTLKALMDTVVTNKSAIIIYTHGVTIDGVGYNVSTAHFEEILDYAIAAGLKVTTMSELYSLMAPRIV
ncbi:MAG: polysaccharide deacetylase family protein [Patescibacteria group bacterium]